jgi:hypothetical protein
MLMLANPSLVTFLLDILRCERPRLCFLVLLFIISIPRFYELLVLVYIWATIWGYEYILKGETLNGWDIIERLGL